MMNNFRLMYLLMLMQEFQLKVACVSFFMSLQEDILGTTQQLTSLNWSKQKNHDWTIRYLLCKDLIFN